MCMEQFDAQVKPVEIVIGEQSRLNSQSDLLDHQLSLKEWKPEFLNKRSQDLFINSNDFPWLI